MFGGAEEEERAEPVPPPPHPRRTGRSSGGGELGGAGGGEASLRAWVGLVWSGLVWLSLAQLAGGRRGDGASVRWVGWNSSLLIEEGMNYQRGTLSYIIRAGNSYTLPYIYVYELVYVVCILASYYKLVVCYAYSS